MSLRLFFEKKDVRNIRTAGIRHDGSIDDVSVKKIDGEIYYVDNTSVKKDIGGLFHTDAFLVVDVLSGTVSDNILSKVAYASIKSSWVGNAVRQPGEYQLGQAHISVSYHETDRWPANNTVNGSSKNLADLVELYQAIKTGNAQRFLRRDYGKPQGGPSYAKLEAQLKAANAARERDANLIRILTNAVERQQQTLRFIERAAKFTKALERHAKRSEEIRDILDNPESARLFAEAVEELETQFAHNIAETKEDL